jgi:hypothetical protein
MRKSIIEITRDIRPSMALEIEPQPAQRRQSPCTPDNLFRLIQSGPVWGVRMNGKLVALGGHTPMWQGRTAVWGFIGADSGPAMLAMTREILRQLEVLQVEFERVEAYVDRHHAEGHRWMRALGFHKEGLMRKFANGIDYVMYARTV